MNNKTLSQKFLIKSFKKMFSMVGVKYSQEFIKKENWYLQHSWNEQQEKEFRAWFIKNIKKDLKISNRKAELEYTWFNLTYGWTGK